MIEPEQAPSPALEERVAALEAMLAESVNRAGAAENRAGEMEDRYDRVTLNLRDSEELAQRVAALEARLVPFSATFSSVPSLTEEQEAQLKRDFDETMRGPITSRFLPSVPPLTPEQVRYLLRECVTVVKPGETLVIRVPWATRPATVRELQDFVVEIGVSLDLPFKVLVLPGDELGIAVPEPDFMGWVNVEPIDGEHLHVRLTHEPTGVTVVARDRAEGVFKLRKALSGRLRRECDLQEQQRRAERKAAKEAGGVPGAA